MNIRKGWSKLDKKRVGIVCGAFALACVACTLLGWHWPAVAAAILCVATPVLLVVVASYGAN